MLADAAPVAFLAARDLERAAGFYGGVLGLEELGDNGFSKLFRVGPSKLRVTKVDRPEIPPYTVFSFDVDDLAGIVDALVAQGVELKRFEGMDQDERGIWTAPSGTRIAWFADPDGNVLSVQQ
jgi:catechol 2,3-dioxygenase-like lactoylglutathione lyase family enzyme